MHKEQFDMDFNASLILFFVITDFRKLTKIQSCLTFLEVRFFVGAHLILVVR